MKSLAVGCRLKAVGLRKTSFFSAAYSLTLNISAIGLPRLVGRYMRGACCACVGIHVN